MALSVLLEINKPLKSINQSDVTAHFLDLTYKHVVHENLIGGSSIIWIFPLLIADSERDMPGIEPWAPRLVHQRSDHWATRSEAYLGFPPCNS